MKKIKPLLLLTGCLMMIGCSGRVLDKSANTVQKSLHVPLSRQYQRTVRYNCNGVISSDRWETVKSPIADVEIHPISSRNIWSSQITNPSTSSTACTSGLTNFRVDLAPGFCNLKVHEGINEIRYSFYYCHDQYYDVVQQKQLCPSSPSLEESGSIFINVTYTETNLTDTRYVRPTPEECKKPN